jgi:hypothetical protein
MLAIEVDGSAHDDQKEYDADRDAWLLHAYGVRAVRLTNREVLGSSDLAKKGFPCVIAGLCHLVGQLPQPSPGLR